MSDRAAERNAVSGTLGRRCWSVDALFLLKLLESLGPVKARPERHPRRWAQSALSEELRIMAESLCRRSLSARTVAW